MVEVLKYLHMHRMEGTLLRWIEVKYGRGSGGARARQIIEFTSTGLKRCLFILHKMVCIR